jgi:outer membrane protein
LQQFSKLFVAELAIHFFIQGTVMKLRRVLICTGLYFAGMASVSAQSNPNPNGWYASVYGTFSSLSSTNIAETRPAAPNIAGQAKFDAGRGIGGAVGKNFDNGTYALEIAWDYQSAGLKSIAGVKVDGDFASNIYWLNGYRRFTPISGWTPYLGAGVGYVQEIDIDIDRAGKELEYSRSGSLGFQAIAGVKRQLNANWSLMADAKYMQVSKGPDRATLAGSALTVRPKYRPLSFHVGVVYSF